MKQILQSLKTGAITIADVPKPALGSQSVLVRSENSLISPGTERMLIEFGKANLLNKVRQQPDKVRMVFDKARTDGISATLESVWSKLESPLVLGYSNVGTIQDLGGEVAEFNVGDRVVSNGPHAQFVAVSKNLCAKVPETVTNEEASFAILGSIALQGVRLLDAKLGETYVVMGLGVVGLLSVQILLANGCDVIATDFDTEKLKIAEQFGAKAINLSNDVDPIAYVQNATGGMGADGVILALSSESNQPVNQAAKMCRRRGSVILVGVTGLALSRAEFYEKEITFQVSCSYGPGRYDPTYEALGIDYPFGLVRWTAKRNIEAFLRLLEKKAVNVKPLITDIYDINDAYVAYERIEKQNNIIGLIINYLADDSSRQAAQLIVNRPVVKNSDHVGVSFVGAGNYAISKLIPAFNKAGANLKIICSKTGTSAYHAGKKFLFEKITTNFDDILNDDDTDAVVIATRHNLHTEMIIDALKAQKHVFVEKPLCLNTQELNKIMYVKNKYAADRILLVGFNRRKSRHITVAMRLLDQVHSPISIIINVNAGHIPENHWIHDKRIGGGRIIGEACHFIDLATFLARGKAISFSTSRMEMKSNDTISISLQFDNGSLAVINYFSNGNKQISKERIEIYADGKMILIDNFMKTTGYGWKKFQKFRTFGQDKGQTQYVSDFLKYIKGQSNYEYSDQEFFDNAELVLKIDEKNAY